MRHEVTERNKKRNVSLSPAPPPPPLPPPLPPPPPPPPPPPVPQHRREYVKEKASFTLSFVCKHVFCLIALYVHDASHVRQKKTHTCEIPRRPLSFAVMCLVYFASVNRRLYLLLGRFSRSICLLVASFGAHLLCGYYVLPRQWSISRCCFSSFLWNGFIRISRRLRFDWFDCHPSIISFDKLFEILRSPGGIESISWREMNTRLESGKLGKHSIQFG